MCCNMSKSSPGLCYGLLTPGGGGVVSPVWKGQGSSWEILKRNPNRCQDPVLWAWLGIFFHSYSLRSNNSKNNTLSAAIFFFLFNTLMSRSPGATYYITWTSKTQNFNFNRSSCKSKHPRANILRQAWSISIKLYRCNPYQLFRSKYKCSTHMLQSSSKNNNMEDRKIHNTWYKHDTSHTGLHNVRNSCYTWEVP